MLGFLSVCLLVAVVSGAPPGFILDVKSNCGKLSTSATIDVTTDLTGKVEVLCKDGFILKLPTADTVHYTGKVLYTGDSKKACVFKNMGVTDVYEVTLEVLYGQPGSKVLTHKDQYRIICVFDNYRQVASLPQEAGLGYTSPKEVQRHAGKAAALSKFDIYLTDVIGKRIKGKVNIGKKVRLEVDMTSKSKTEVSFKVASCVAESGANSYQVIRAGCGDGIIFPVKKGFVTTGTSAKSPLFKSFKLIKGSSITFACNFTTCSSKCEGDSCHLAARKRRSVDEDPAPRVYVARSRLFGLHSREPVMTDERWNGSSSAHHQLIGKVSLDEVDSKDTSVLPPDSRQSLTKLPGHMTPIIQTVYLNKRKHPQDLNIKISNPPTENEQELDQEPSAKGLDKLEITLVICVCIMLVLVLTAVSLKLRFTQKGRGNRHIRYIHKVLLPSLLPDQMPVTCCDCQNPLKICMCRVDKEGVKYRSLDCREPLAVCKSGNEEKCGCCNCGKPLDTCTCASELGNLCTICKKLMKQCECVKPPEKF